MAVKERLAKDKAAQALLKKLMEGEGGYLEGGEYAELAGAALAEVYAGIAPGAQISEEDAKTLLQPIMQENYDLVTEAAKLAQKNINARAGIGLNSVSPKLRQDRVNGLAKVLAEKPDEDISAALVNFSRGTMDDHIKANAETQYKAGLEAKIIRAEIGGCCEWCKNLAGEYSYPNIPKDVYRRHQRCRCTVDYICAKGRQNVHTREWRDPAESDRIERRKTVGLEPSDSPETAKLKEELIDQVKALPPEAQEALRSYTGFDATAVNFGINHGRITPRLQEKIDALDDALRDGVMLRDVVLYRDTNIAFLGLGIPETPSEANLADLIDRVVTNSFFTSTSFQPLHLPGRDTEILLHVPAGYKGCQYLKPVALPKFKGQDEVLFARGMQYQIRFVNFANGKLTLEAEVLPR